ncbi:MAG: N-acetyltransferase family protein [Acetanaerobacterium sp.]
MEKDIVIRRARIDDAPALYEINRDALGYDFDGQQTRARLCAVVNTQNNRLYVALVNGCVAGYIHAADYDCIYAPSVKNLLALAVREDARGLGVGRMLLREAEQWALDSGAQGIRLSSGADRTGAHAFYQACGYTHRKDQKNFIKLF